MDNGRVVRLVLLLALSFLAACGANGSAAGQVAAGTAVPEPVTRGVVSATGQVRPARWAALSFPIDGQIKAIAVQEGQGVAAGQPLAELDAVRLDRSVAEAQAALAAAEAELAQVKAEAHPAEVAAAEQTLAAALAQVRAAEAGVELAEAELSRATAAGAIATAQVAVAEAQVKVAQAELTRAKAGARPEDLSAARATLAKARAAVGQAQTGFDRAGRAGDSPEGLALEQATLDLEIAQAGYDALLAGPRPSDLASLQAAVGAAQAQAALVRAQAGLAPSQVAAAEAAVAQVRAGVEAAQAEGGRAQAALDRLHAGPTAERVAIAQAAVARAREAAATAQAFRGQATLVAPFDGTISVVQVRPGEQVLPAAAVMILGDLGTLQVETTDLDEVDVARVAPGQRATLSCDALPDRTLAGHVVRVAPMARPGQGATTYTVIIALDEGDAALRWGMTVFVDIDVE